MRSFILCLGFLLVTSGQLSAATKAERIKDCMLGLLSEDEQSVLLADMTEWKNLFSTYVVENISACYTKITGQPAEFENGKGLVFDPALIPDVKAARDNLAKKQNRLKELSEIEKCLTQKAVQIEKLKGFMLDFYMDENNALINDRTYTACANLNEVDPNAAILNTTCRDIFAKRLHPDLPEITLLQDYASIDRAYKRNLAQFAAVNSEIKTLKGEVPEQTKSYGDRLKEALAPCD
jgi:hypothetical protein